MPKVFSVALIGVAASSCPHAKLQGLLDAVFQGLGNDCGRYDAVFGARAKYYHQHDGFKTKAEMLGTCQGYGQFCPSGGCLFQQDGDALIKETSDGACHILAPYLWSEIPANHLVPGNLEPHSGWEYIIAEPADGEFDYKISHFAEIETSFSLAYNWARPDDTPAVAQSTLDLLSQTASKGECNNPIAPWLTNAFATASASGTSALWRQQGSAVLLAAGGVCHVAVPYAAALGSRLQSGVYVYQLVPRDSSYEMQGTPIAFKRSEALKFEELANSTIV